MPALLVLFCVLLAAILPGWAQPALSLDGVTIGMDYSEVLRERGRPQALRPDGELTQLLFPAASGRREGTSVWFHRDKVVFATGYDLYGDGEPVFLYGMEGPVLEEAFGTPEPLNVFSRWFPASGVVLGGYLNQWPLETVTSPLGLRDLSYPLDWYDSRSRPEDPARRWSRSEPWMDDEIVVWLAEDVELGMAEDKARKLAGGLEIDYDGGFVRAIRRPAEALLSHRVGYHDFSTEFIVGDEPVTLGLAAAPPGDGWYSPASGGRVRIQAGKVAEIELRIDNDALFRALRAAPRP